MRPMGRAGRVHRRRSILEAPTACVCAACRATVERMTYWACAQLDQRRERLALHYLDLAGFSTYVPRVRGSRRTIAALFPSYAFIAIQMQWHAARWAPGVWKLIMSGDEPARVPDRIIADLQEREGRDGLIRLPKPSRLNGGARFQPGDQVRVINGPLTGLSALVQGMRGHQRVEVLLTMLGGLQRAELATADVRRA
jgi:transcriptional antiterminator RfaH